MSLHLESPTFGTPARGRLDFLWLELTHRCNLRCVHCYADSSPETVDRDLLQVEDYLRAMVEARALGCRQVQFIGGEPTLNRGLPAMIAEARRLDYELVEVYTNLIALPERLLEAMVQHRVSVATSAAACSMGELCGGCAGNVLAIGPDGIVAPCVMSNDPNCYPNCSPMTNCNPCAPNGGNKCQPNDFCNPAK